MENNWATLPTEILGVILNKLSITDQYFFNFVCRPWYSAACEAADLNVLHPISSPPWLLVFPQPISVSSKGNAIIDTDDNTSYYNPVNKKICKHTKIVWRPPPLEEALCVGSCYGWLAFIDINCVIYLQNPFGRRGKEESSSIIRLPPIDTLPCIESSTILPDGNIEYMYCFSIDDFVCVEEDYGHFVHSLVMSSSPSLSEECIVMMIYGPQYELAVCRLGDMSWTPLNGNLTCNCNLYYSASKKLFHVLGNQYENSFEIWDFAKFSLPKSTCFNKLHPMPIAPPTLSIDKQKLRKLFRQHKYLAELNDKLLLVVRHIDDNVDKDGQIIDHVDDNGDPYYKTFGFDAYEFDWSKQQWVLVNSLGSNGDDVLFLGNNNAMTFSTRDFPGMQSNSIYFTDDYVHYFLFMESGKSYGGHDLGIFSFNNNKIDHCYYFGDSRKICPTPVWISPNPY